MRKLLTISLPPDLHARIKAKKGTNVSLVCQKAIEKHLEYLEGIDTGRLPSVRTLVTQIHNAVCVKRADKADKADKPVEESKPPKKKKASKNGKSTNGKA